MKVDPAKIEASIREAFRCTAPISSLSKYEAEELNYDIHRYDNPAVQKLLPLLLIREMHTLASGERAWSSDGLIYFLDGYLMGRIPASESPEELTSYKYLCDSRAATFSQFTHKQAAAILLWLENIAYRVYKDDYHKDLESAMLFWKDKVI